MPIIQVQMLKGRDMAQKRAMIREMTDAFTRNCGGDASEVNIIISEIDGIDWGSNGILCEELKKNP